MVKNRSACAFLATALTVGTFAFTPMAWAEVMPTTCEGIENCEVVTSAEELTNFFAAGEGKFVTREGVSTMIIGGDFTLSQDYYIDSVNLSLYLGEHTITANDCSFLFYDSTVNIYGGEGGGIDNSAAYYSPLYVRGGSSVTINGGTISGGQNLVGEYEPEAGVIVDENGSLTLKGGVVTSKTWGVTVWENSNFVMDGGEVRATGEGSIGVSGNGNTTGAHVTINGGTITSGELGIYAPQKQGVTTINGGVINALAGVEIRAGALDIIGGVINVPADTEYSISANGNGSTTTGAAIAVAQHTTLQSIDVNVTGGVFTAPVVFAEANPQHNPGEDIAKVSLSITGGTFNATNGDPIVTSEDVTGFVAGGTFSKTFDGKYLKEGYSLVSVEKGFEAISPAELDPADEIETVKDEDGNDVSYIAPKKVDYGDGYIEDGGEGEGHVSAAIEFGKELIADRKATLSVVEKSIDDLTIDGAKGGDLIGAVEIDMLDRDGQKIEVKDNALKIYFDIDDETYAKLAEYDDLYAVYFEDGKEVERYKITLEGEAGNYYFWFETTHLSTYAVVGVNEVAASAPETGMSTTTGASATMTSSVVMAAVIGVLTSVVSFVYLARRKQ